MNICVLICNHNYGQYLKKCIDSALAQTLKPTCVAIIDDNSSDNSWDIISSFIEPYQIEEQIQDSPHGDVHIKVGQILTVNNISSNEISILAVRLPIQVGPSESRNVLIRMTKNSVDAYQILDADDEMLPTKLEELVKPLENPQVGGVYGDYYIINKDNGVKTLEIKTPYDIYKLNQESIIHSGALIRTRFLEMIKENDNYYDPSMRTCEDWDLWLRLSKVCLFHHVAKPLTNVLVHSKNSTNSVDKSIWQANWNKIKEKHSK